MRFIVLLLFLTHITLLADPDSRAVRLMQTEQRVALVIGNNNYQGVLSKLKNPVNDASAIKGILQNRGFRVIYIENATKREMRTKLNDFYKEISRGGVGLLYFAGHGIEVEGKNYIIPTDAQLGDKIDAEFEAIALNRITKKIVKLLSDYETKPESLNRIIRLCLNNVKIENTWSD